MLVAEDEHSVREIINRVPYGKVYRVLMASDGNEGLRVSGSLMVEPGIGFARHLEVQT